MKKRSLEFLAILYLIQWTFVPLVQIGMNYRLIALGCAGFLFIRNGFALDGQRGAALLFCLMAAVSAVIATGSISSALAQISLYMLFIGYAMNAWYERQWTDFRFIIPITLLSLAFWNYRTLIVLATDPIAARAVVRDDEIATGYLMQGVGGYALMYCQVLIAPAIIKWTQCSFRKNKALFACGAVWTVSFVGYLMEAGYSIALVGTLAGVIVLFFYRRRSVSAALAVSFLIVAVLVYLIVYNEAVRNYLLTAFEGTKVARKIEDITSTVTTDQTADSIAQRIISYQTSLEAIFLRYPIIGSWAARYAGGHSAILDAFALYGIFGGVIMCRMIYCVPMMWKKYDCTQATMRTVNATIVTISFVSWLDSVPFNLTMTLTVLLPILLTDIESWSGKNEHLMDSKPDSRRISG